MSVVGTVCCVTLFANYLLNGILPRNQASGAAELTTCEVPLSICEMKSACLQVRWFIANTDAVLVYVHDLFSQDSSPNWQQETARE